MEKFPQAIPSIPNPKAPSAESKIVETESNSVGSELDRVEVAPLRRDVETAVPEFTNILIPPSQSAQPILESVPPSPQIEDNRYLNSIKHEYGKVSYSVSRLVNVLSKRNSEYLSELVSAEDVRLLSSGGRYLSDPKSFDKLNVDELSRSFRMMQKGLHNFGRSSSRGPLRESAESLRAVRQWLSETTNQVVKIKQVLNSADQRSDILIACCNNFRKTIDEALQVTAFKLRALDQYRK